MKPLIPQTVYVPTKNNSDFKVLDPTFGESNAYVKTIYCLTKEELAKLLDDAYSAGVDWDIFDNTTPSKQEYINNLLNQQ